MPRALAAACVGFGRGVPLMRVMRHVPVCGLHGRRGAVKLGTRQHMHGNRRALQRQQGAQEPNQK
jgi:hypothetical protein